MIKQIKINKIWQGQVAIADREVDEALAKGYTLKLINNGSYMLIPPDQIDNVTICVSIKQYIDRFNVHPPYRLVYFDWRPTHIQGHLLF
jgi:hypothetical protein